MKTTSSSTTTLRKDGILGLAGENLSLSDLHSRSKTDIHDIVFDSLSAGTRRCLQVELSTFH